MPGAITPRPPMWELEQLAAELKALAADEEAKETRDRTESDPGTAR